MIRFRKLQIIGLLLFLFTSCADMNNEIGLSLRTDVSVHNAAIDIKDSIIWELPKVESYCDSLSLIKKYVNIGNCQLYVEQEGKGLPIVLISGGPGATHQCFHPWFTNASSFAKVIYYDQRGSGLSEYNPELGYSVEQSVNDLEELRKRLKIDKWVVAGHSFGGFLAQYYSMLYPESLLGLIVIGGSTGLHTYDAWGRGKNPFLTNEEFNAFWKVSLEIERIGKESDFPTDKINQTSVFNRLINGEWKYQYYFKPSTEEMSRMAKYYWKFDQENNFREEMSNSQKKLNLAGAFVNFPIPTLIIEGLWDNSWKISKPLALSRNHPNADLEIFTNSAHSPFIDEPKKFFNLIESFMLSLKRIPDSVIDRYVTQSKKFEPTLSDKFLLKTISIKEDSIISSCNNIKKTILSGEPYHNQSSPQQAYLSFISAVKNKDLDNAKRIQNEIWTLEKLRGHSYLLEETVLWRTPPPPKQPHQGQIWPVYLKDIGHDKWFDTILFIFWDDQWHRVGNTSGPYGDWREMELFHIKNHFMRL